MKASRDLYVSLISAGVVVSIRKFQVVVVGFEDYPSLPYEKGPSLHKAVVTSQIKAVLLDSLPVQK